MWFNQAKCDIYMGTGAGTKLLKEIGNAQKSVKISSPYLSPALVNELIWLHNKEVKVSLITSDHLEGGNQKLEQSIKPLIVQQQKLDERAKRIRNRWIIMEKALLWGSALVIFGVLTATFLAGNWLYLFSLTLPIVLYLISGILKNKIKSMQIYTYQYKSLFPFKVFVTPDSNRINSRFIHGKIYIIDGLTAYLGSLNFTESGTKYNYETRIRVTDKEAVKKIDAEFDEIYNDPEMAYFGIQQWGKQLYHEALN